MSTNGPAVTSMVLATRNVGKLRELRQLVAEVASLAGLKILSIDDAAPGLPETVESGVTFEQNAALKAHAVARATGLPAVADDSGLAVDVLGGCPGVFSALWSGTHGADQANIDLLLAQTVDVPIQQLTAHFVSCVVLALPDGSQQVQYGEVHGQLTRDQRGTNGFGYDPVFELPDGRTLAQLSDEEKNAISHRGNAFRALLPDLVTLLGHPITSAATNH